MKIAQPLVALVFSGLVALGLGACCTAKTPVEPAPTPTEPTPTEPTPADPGGIVPADPTDPGKDPGSVTPNPIEPEMCGGIAGKACAAGQFCDLEGHCGAGDQSGVCRVTPEMCTRDYRPVCGCDGKTYGNACTAHAAGVSVQAKGPCPGATP